MKPTPATASSEVLWKSKMNWGKSLGALGLTSLAVIVSPFAAAEEPGWYGGFNVGRSRASFDEARISNSVMGAGVATTTFSDRNRSTGFKIFGGYEFTPNIALEGGYFDLGKFGFTANTLPAGTLDGNLRTRGVNLDMVGKFPMTEKFSALGRIGVNYATTRDSFTGTGAANVINPNPSKRGANLKVGLGLQYDFTEAFGMRAEIERYRVNDAVGGKGNVDMLSLGLIYRFGGKTPTPVPRAAVEPAYVAAAPAPAVVPPPPPPPPPPTKVTFAADSLFDFDRATLKPEGKQALDKFASDLRGVRYDAINVTGHTDRIGSHNYNLKLSSRRAEAVRDYLVSSAGVPAANISATGVDGANPVTKPGECKGSKPTKALIACLQPDRRVEVEVTGTR